MTASAAPALAQVPPAPPPLAPPVPTREEVQRAAPERDERDRSRLNVQGGIERAPCALDDARFANVSFVLQSATFAGLKGLAPADLTASYADYVGKRVPIAVVCQIRDAAATTLRQAGYVAAVQVPPQTIVDGIVKFDVLMAKLVSLRVRGDAGRSEKLIARYLAKLQDREVFNEREAERYLLLARDLPGYDVFLTLRPAGGKPGEVIGEVTATRQRYRIEANVQNFGSKTVGRFGGLLSAETYDLFGLGDRATVGLFNTFDTREQTVLQAGYDARLGGEGLTFSVRGTRAWTRPDAGAADPLRSRTFVGSFEASYPFIRRQRGSLRGSVGLDLIDQRLRFGPTPLTEDKARIAYLKIDADVTDADSYLGGRGFNPVEPRFRAYGSLELRRGLDVFGASRDCGPAPFYPLCAGGVSLSRIEADPTATVARFTAQGEYRPRPGLALVIQPRFQYSLDPLISYEEYSGGSYTAGRGYDPGTIVGDSGIGFQSEVRIGSIAPKSASSFAVQPFALFDAAKVWNKSSPIPAIGADRLYSVGAGVRAVYGNRARIDLTLAQPLVRAGLLTRRGDPRLLLTLTTRLLPWNRQ